MDCDVFEALAVDLLYDELSPERRSEAQAHAASCAECGKLSKELDEARKTAASLPARIAPPSELDARIAMAARAAAGVRAHPLRGSALHVAAAAVLAAVLVGVSFTIGVKVGKPGPADKDDEDLVRRLSKHDDKGLTSGDSRPRYFGPNLPIDQTRKYMEDMLGLANDDLAKGEVKRALMEFGGVYSSGGRTAMALEARIGMAKCYRALGQLEDARAAARDAREKNMDWGTNWDNVEDDSTKLLKEINQELQTKQAR